MCVWERGSTRWRGVWGGVTSSAPGGLLGREPWGLRRGTPTPGSRVAPGEAVHMAVGGLHRGPCHTKRGTGRAKASSLGWGRE